jgi:hypothetical protein
MRSIAIMLTLTLILSVIAHASCPPGFLSKTETFLVPDGLGGCCPVEVSFCYKSTTTQFIVSYGTIKFYNQDCSVLFGPGLFNFLSKKILLKYDPDVNVCPLTTTKVLDETKSSCYAVASAPVNTLPIEFVPCGNSICKRICTYCKSVNDTDPCSGEPMINYLGCQFINEVCTPDSATNCIINTCS